jgi:hypothetical protein
LRYDYRAAVGKRVNYVLNPEFLDYNNAVLAASRRSNPAIRPSKRRNKLTQYAPQGRLDAVDSRYGGHNA